MRSNPAPDRLYEADFYDWTRQQALALRRFARTRPNLPLDLEHVVEAIQDLGKNERDTVYSLAQRVIERFLLIARLPENCPDTIEQVLGDWLPEVEARAP